MHSAWTDNNNNNTRNMNNENKLLWLYMRAQRTESRKEAVALINEAERLRNSPEFTERLNDN